MLGGTAEAWDFAFDLNVKSMFRVCPAVIPGMLEFAGGCIVNIGSIYAQRGLPDCFACRASKAA